MKTTCLGCGNDITGDTCGVCLGVARAKRDAKRLANAELVEYTGGMIYTDATSHNDGYFHSLTELKEYAGDNGYRSPFFAFVCQQNEFKLDLRASFDQAENACGIMDVHNYEPDYIGIAHLDKAVAEFNKLNACVGAWDTDFKQKVRVR